MNFNSAWTPIAAPAEKVFDKASDLEKLGEAMPEQIVNWKASSETCSFTIKGMTSLSLRIDEKKAPHFMRLVPEGKSPVEFELLLHVKQTGNETCSAMVEIVADLNPMLALIAKRPLQNLVDTIAASLGNWSY